MSSAIMMIIALTIAMTKISLDRKSYKQYLDSYSCAMYINCEVTLLSYP